MPFPDAQVLARGASNYQGMTYKMALLQGLLTGVVMYAVTAAGRYATATSAIPYGIGTAVLVGLALCAFIAYRNGQPNKQ